MQNKTRLAAYAGLLNTGLVGTSRPDTEIKPQTLEDVFTRDERLRMAYVPVVVTESIWEYIGRVIDYCAANRIEATKKLTRSVKAMRQAYYKWLQGSIDGEHLTVARICAQGFQRDFVNDITIMWFTLNGELKKLYPDAPDQEMRTDALCAILLIRLVKSFCADIDAQIEQRLNATSSTLNPFLRDLDEIIDAYVGDCEIDRTVMVKRCEVILRRAMESIKYIEVK